MLVKLRKKITDQLDELAHQSMQTPSVDPFSHGMQVGRYRALSEVIEEITQALKDDDE